MKNEGSGRGAAKLKSARLGVRLWTLLGFFRVCCCLDAAEINLLTVGASGDDGVSGGALFYQGAQGSGTGNYVAIVRLQHNGTEKGYNTGYTPKEFDETSSFSQNLQISDIPVKEVNGTWYGYFGLDVNEVASGDKKYISIDTIEIYLSDTADNHDYAGGNLGTKVYDLDDADGDGTTEDNVVLLDATLSSGSGSSDMEFLFPISILSGWGTDDYLYLYSEFGAYGGGNPTTITNWTTSDGFEEWAWDQNASTYYGQIPEPSAGVSLLLGCALAASRRRRRAVLTG